MSRRTVVGGLDIGNTAIRACVGMVDGNSRIHIVGIGSSPADGVERGVVVDEEKFATAIRRAVREATAASNVTLEDIFVGVGGSFTLGASSSTNSDNAIAADVLDVVQNTGLRVAKTVETAVATGRAVLSAAERARGVALIDFGGSSTDIALFRGGDTIATKVVPVGGDHVTYDIAYGLDVPSEQAEQLKLRYGAAVPELAAADHTTGTGHGRRQLGLFEIVEARVEELLELIDTQLADSLPGGPPAAGIVLTGGSALLGGIQQAAARKLGADVRIGVADKVLGPVDAVTSPVYAGAVGLVYWGAEQAEAVPPSGANGTGKGGLLDSIKDWLSEFL